MKPQSHSSLQHFYLFDGLQTITNKEQIHQITRVLRLQQGNKLIGIHAEKEFLLEIKTLEKDCIELSTIEELIQKASELPFHLKIYLPLLKGDKNELVLQKCTELGTHEFQFVEFDHSVKQHINWQHKLERWQKIIIEAVEQSERVKLPTVKESIAFENISLMKDESGIAFVERLEEKYKFEETRKSSQKISLIFGPEGGFSAKEKILLKEKGFQNASLGERILRAETAIMAGCSLFGCLE